MNKIEDFQKKNVNNIIKVAANSAMDKLKKYYKYTDALVYTVSTSMFLFFCNFILIILSFNIFFLLFS